MESLKTVFSQFLSFSNKESGTPNNAALIMNNDDWLSRLSYFDLLRHVGRDFTINRMLTMDSVKLRLEREQPLTFLEFNYMILQAYDFLQLNALKKCRVQMGGSDQWGNIVSGIELNRRHGHPQTFGITSPLITTASGAKMGKTAAGAFWLNADLLSPYDYWQFWRNTEDADVVKFLKLFTELSMDEIAKLAALEGAEINEAKKVLATEATALLHGSDAAERAAQTAADTFAGSGVSTDLPEITISNISASIIELLVTAGFAASNGEARRLIQGNGININDVKVTDEKQCLKPADFGQGFAKLSKGKKQHVLVKIA
jgi:tyrosyl-tRNA synthetase